MGNDIEHFRAIRAEPFDPGPRLVYADVLEERGASARAEMIRLAVAAEADPNDRDVSGRLKELTADWRPKMVQGLPHCDRLEWGPIRGGLIQSATLMGLEAIRRLPNLVGSTPLGHVILKIHGPYLPDAFRLLASSPARPELWGLTLNSQRSRYEDFRDSPYENLEYWSERAHWGMIDIDRWIAPNWENLRYISLVSTALDDQSWGRFAESGTFGRLSALGIHNKFLSINTDFPGMAHALTALGGSVRAGGLRWLDLTGTRLGRDSAEGFASRAHWSPGLRVRVDGFKLPTEAYRILDASLGDRLTVHYEKGTTNNRYHDRRHTYGSPGWPSFE